MSDPELIIDAILASALTSVTLFHVWLLEKYFWMNSPGFSGNFQAIMMFSKWITSEWKTDKGRRYKRYYIRYVKGEQSRIASLGVQTITGAPYQAAPAESKATVNF